MPITYPLDHPATPCFKNSTFRCIPVVAASSSPFTGATQIVKHRGHWWEAELTLPKMERARAAEWQAFLLKLNGIYGTFRLGDPDAAAPRGAVTGTTLVDGASQTGTSLDVKNLPVSVTGVFLAGDYISVNDELKMVVNDADSDGSGLATLDILPAIRVSPADSAVVTYSAPKGLFRLSSNQQGEWSTDDLSIYDITFAVREAF